MLCQQGAEGFTQPLHLQVSQASAAAREAVERAGDALAAGIHLFSVCNKAQGQSDLLTVGGWSTK